MSIKILQSRFKIGDKIIVRAEAVAKKVDGERFNRKRIIVSKAFDNASFIHAIVTGFKRIMEGDIFNDGDCSSFKCDKSYYVVCFREKPSSRERYAIAEDVDRAVRALAPVDGKR